MCVCVCGCIVLLENITLNQLKSGSRTSNLSSAVGPRGQHLLLFCLSGDRDFFFFFFKSGIVILEGHLPPQRQTSLNSSGRQTVTGVMETRPAGPRAQLSD